MRREAICGDTYAGEHVRHRAGNLDTEQPGDTEQEAEYAGDDAAPHKHPRVPFEGAEQLRETLHDEASVDEDAVLFWLEGGLL